MHLLLVVSVDAEAAAVRRGHPDAKVIVAGVGPAAAAAATARALASMRVEGVVSLGIGGGVAAAAGDVLLADRVVAADLGAETAEGVLSLDDLDLGTTTITTDRRLTDHVLAALARDLVVHRGDILTVWTATGTAATAQRLRAQHPAAVGEAMEGYGVAMAATAAGTPFTEVRTVSNVIGPRDRGRWDLPAALESLYRVSAGLLR